MLPQAPQMSIPAPAPPRITAGADYRLGTGDTVEVVLAGRVDVTRQVAMVSADGNITVPPVGAVAVGGLTIIEAQQRIAARARPLYRYLDLTVNLLSPRSFEVTVSGEVERPGTLVLSATERVHQVILLAGGVTPRGSLRNILLLRGGREERRVDLLRFLLSGDLDNNPYVTEGTTIAIPPRGPSVTLSGAFVRPGEYEIGDRGSLFALLVLTGGTLTQSAPAEARLTRIGPDGKKATLPLDLTTAVRPPADVELHTGDGLYVPPLAVAQDVVEVRGAFGGTPESAKTITAGKPTIVQRFELAGGERVLDVVQRAGGATPYADLGRAVIDRRGPSGPRQLIPVDLHRLLVEKDEAQNIPLENGDVLTLPIAEDKVYVVGAVKAPGAVDYRSNLTSREYLALAGGPTGRAKMTATMVTFPNGRTYPMVDAPPLEPGAVMTVPEVTVKWWEDWGTIATLIATLVTAYTGIFILFGGASNIQRLNQ
jgi:protein involved in polysaccharide export with SLBB domain